MELGLHMVRHLIALLRHRHPSLASSSAATCLAQQEMQEDLSHLHSREFSKY